MKAIPVPVRERILHLYDRGKSTGEIATSLGYCIAAVRRCANTSKHAGRWNHKLTAVVARRC
jgi:hypothetical protein